MIFSEDYPVVLSFHTHAKGPPAGWFGAGIHPCELDGNGAPVMGTEWRVSMDGCKTLKEVITGVQKKVDEEMKRRWDGVLFNNECPVCQVNVPAPMIDEKEPTIIHEEKSDQHRVVYDGISNFR